MMLSDEEALEAAIVLCESNTDQKWSRLSEKERDVYIQLVRDLAALLHVHRSPEAFAVFLRWMGAG